MPSTLSSTSKSPLLLSSLLRLSLPSKVRSSRFQIPLFSSTDLSISLFLFQPPNSSGSLPLNPSEPKSSTPRAKSVNELSATFNEPSPETNNSPPPPSPSPSNPSSSPPLTNSSNLRCSCSTHREWRRRDFELRRCCVECSWSTCRRRERRRISRSSGWEWLTCWIG